MRRGYSASITRASRTLVAALVLLVVGACSSEAEQAEDAFLASCEAAGGTQSACQCSVDSLKDKYGDAVVIRITKGDAPPDFMQAMQEAADQCRFQ